MASDASGTLSGKVALVTGGARGIGRAVVEKLASEGAAVVVDYFSSHEEAAALVERIERDGGRAKAVQASVAMPGEVDRLFDEIDAAFGRLDVVVHAAATGVLRPVSELGPKHWRWCLETNALALALLANRAAGLLRDSGRIVALSSEGARRALPGYAFVGASKAALESLVRSLAVELGSRGITVNAVSAGPVDTDALRAFPNRDEILERAVERAVDGRPLAAEDVANAVYLLCLPEAARITGRTIVVDAGMSLAP